MLLSAKLHDCYNVGQQNTHQHCPKVGQACVARFQGSWYRVEVIGEALCFKGVLVRDMKSSFLIITII